MQEFSGIQFVYGFFFSKRLSRFLSKMHPRADDPSIKKQGRFESTESVKCGPLLRVYAACIRFCKAADKPLVSKKKIPYKSFKV